jgi:hypothetical protein
VTGARQAATFLGLGGLLTLGAIAACRAAAPSADPLDTPASPQAKAEPAPLAKIPTTTANEKSGAPATLDGGNPPTPLRGDQPVATDAPGKEGATYELEALLRPSDVSPPPKGPDVNLSAYDAARRKTELRLTIDLSPTHARFVLASDGFVLPQGTELRARVDRFGHVVVAADGATYRIAAPGALRALLGERRLDVAPFSAVELGPSGDGPKRLGRPTRREELSTRAARGTFEIAHIVDLGEGGTLVCRALLDLMNASPSTPLCGDGDLPLYAELRWTAPPPLAAGHPVGGTIVFDVLGFARRTDLSAQLFAVPPGNTTFDEALPGRSDTALHTAAELGAFRNAGTESTDGPLTLVNSTDELRFAWLDGIPVAWLAPGARTTVRGLARGRYGIQWRTFLGDAINPVQTVTLPAASDAAGPDGGSP